VPTTSSPQLAYGYARVVDLSFEAALEKTRETLKQEGFGVLCEIDIQAKLREKLAVEMQKYVILGACNPPLAHQALQQEPALGLLLPCNAIVYENEQKQTVVAAIDAQQMLSVVGNPAMQPIADQVNEKLRRAIDAV
jgi:uncharacterized protein (DUF302 family)